MTCEEPSFLLCVFFGTSGFRLLNVFDTLIIMFFDYLHSLLLFHFLPDLFKFSMHVRATNYYQANGQYWNRMV